MKKDFDILPWLTAIVALGLSTTAAYYSVTGLAKLFAGASMAVIIFTSLVEAAKVIGASVLYQYRKTLPKSIKIYLTAAVVVAMIITSVGIYGFLSSSYQVVAAESGKVDAQIELLESRKTNYEGQITNYITEKENLNESIGDLRDGLTNNVIQYKDKETGEILTTTSSATRKALERQLDNALERQGTLNTKVDSLNTIVFNLNDEITQVKLDEGVSELGPLKYVAGITDLPMDNIVNYLILILIFVFDPLAMVLVITANFLFTHREGEPKKRSTIKNK